MALPRSHNELSEKLQASLGIPEGMQVSSPFPFKGMNQKDSRTALPDNEFFLLENFIKIGEGKLRTVWDQGSPIYSVSTGKTIVYYFFYTISLTNYCAVFLSDGTAVQVNTATLGQTVISSASGTFYTGGQLPCCASWGAQYLIIANNITPNSYWIWDGALLYSAGSLSPTVTLTSGGSGYSSVPAVTAFGGLGSGAIFSVSIADGSVVSVVVTNPGTGYRPGDVVQLVFSGGGSDSGAELSAVLTTGTIGHVELLSGGSGYTSPSVSITGGGGSGATATAVETGGVITSITLTNPGSGYTSTPTVGITDGGPGSGATAVAILNPGSLASVTVVNGGSGYNSTPTLAITGGGGTGATAVANITSGSISSVTVTDAGSGYTSAPTITVQSGINNAASGTIELMPFGVSGSSIETYDQHVWLPFPNQTGKQNNAGTFLMSAPESLTDFAASDGGLIYQSSSPFLRAQYYNIKQSNGYLYPFGDSSVDVISNVQTSGNPTITTFNYQNTDPQSGTSWRDSYAAYARSILFGNIFGVFGLYGGAATKISTKMDDLFTNAILPPAAGAVTPCSAVANIFSQKVFLFLMTIQDPLTFENRNVMLGWDEKEWYLLSQASVLTYISTQVVNSNLIAYGTDGKNLFPMFSGPSTALTKRLSTKLYGADSQILQKTADMIVVQARDLSVAQAGIAFETFTVDTENGSYPMPVTVSFVAPKANNTVYSAAPENVFGCNLGITLASNSADFEINYLALGHRNVSSVYGSTDLPTTTGE